MTGRLIEMLTERASEAILTALETGAAPDVRATSDRKFGDYQINGVLPLARQLKATPGSWPLGSSSR